MKTDIRLSSGFLDHPKTVKLERKLGLAGFKGLLRLWFFCRENRPKGNFNGMTDDDIEIAAKWDGEPGALVEAMIEIGWLNRNGNNALYVHDWQHHQPWSYFAEERAEKARASVMQRWNKKGKNTKRIRRVYETNTTPNTPSPIPIPSPKPKNICEDPALKLYEYYTENVINVPAKKRDALKNIGKRLNDGFTYQQLGKAISKYADECDEKKIEMRYHANNFFGQKEYFKGYLPEESPSTRDGRVCK